MLLSCFWPWYLSQATEKQIRTEWYKEEYSGFRDKRKMGGMHVGTSKSCMLTRYFCEKNRAKDVTFHGINFPWEEGGHTACLKQTKLDSSPICPFTYPHPPTVLIRTSFLLHTTVPKMKFWMLFNSLTLSPKTLYLIFQEFLPHPVLISVLKYVP